jgi:hypothetical protein
MWQVGLMALGLVLLAMLTLTSIFLPVGCAGLVVAGVVLWRRGHRGLAGLAVGLALAVLLFVALDLAVNTTRVRKCGSVPGQGPSVTFCTS